MRQTLMIVALFIVLPGFSFEIAPSFYPQQVSKYDPWEKLENKQGWILLGYWGDKPNPMVEQVDGELWASKIDFKVMGESRSFPVVGDLLHLERTFTRLVIEGYKITGEAKVLVSPANRQLTKNDFTDYFLVVGTRVRVDLVQVSDSHNQSGVKAVWVLVSPI